jgi:hypothetical protein
MTDDLCSREAEVLRACESGTWTSGLEQHLATCDSCREVETVARALRLAVAAEPATSVQDASAIWWRAQWQARQDARTRAMLPIDTIERAEPLVALVVVATLLVLRGEAIAGRVFAWLAADATGHALQSVMPPAILPLLIVGAGIGGLVLLVGLGAVLASD